MIEIYCQNCDSLLQLPDNASEQRFEADIKCKNCGHWWRIGIAYSKVEKIISTSTEKPEASTSIDLMSLLLKINQISQAAKKEGEQEADTRELG